MIQCDRKPDIVLIHDVHQHRLFWISQMDITVFYDVNEKLFTKYPLRPAILNKPSVHKTALVGDQPGSRLLKPKSRLSGLVSFLCKCKLPLSPNNNKAGISANWGSHVTRSGWFASIKTSPKTNCRDSCDL